MTRNGILVILLSLFTATLCCASDLDEFKIKRKENFTFDQEPRITRHGKDTEIVFSVRDYCDVTVAIEDQQGQIIRHLVSGVLGANAPAPFQRDSLKQTLTWDGKDDQGYYVNDLDACTLRVSLGLKPVFERTLFWEPKKRVGAGLGSGVSTNICVPVPLMTPTPEGVYVFEGHGVDQLRLFDHAGKYVRTVYPFPANKLDAVQGLNRVEFPQDGQKLPYKVGCQRSTLLTAGSNADIHTYVVAEWGTAADSMAIQGSQIALCHLKLNRIATDGSTGGLPLTGAQISYPAKIGGMNIAATTIDVSPLSAAFSPDGKWLYLTGYLYRNGIPGRSLSRDGLSGVVRLEYGKDTPPEIFVGSMKPGESGSSENKLKCPAAVACDAKGRVYVADYGNDRVQIFEPDGKLFKSIATPRPVKIFIDPKSNEIHVCSWLLQNTSTPFAGKVPATYTRFGPAENPAKKTQFPLPFHGYEESFNQSIWGGLEHNVAIDFFASPPAIWVVSNGGKSMVNFSGQSFGDTGTTVGDSEATSGWDNKNIRIFTEKNGKFELTRDFAAEVKESVQRSRPPFFWRQRLYVNPKNGCLYLGEGDPTRWFKAFLQLVEFNPESGKIRMVDLPFDAEDAAFDHEGMIYLRTNKAIARYEPETWREVPFDYGDELKDFGFCESRSDGRRTDLISALSLGCPPYIAKWHNGGLYVSLKGNIVVPSCVSKDGSITVETKDDKNEVAHQTAYEPPLFPGRMRFGEVHVYDKHGKRIYEDAMPGITSMFGIGMDKDDNLYALTNEARCYDGKPFFDPKTGTLLKVAPKQCRFISDEQGGKNPPIPLPKHQEPKRPPELYNIANKWVEGVKWLYGGLGYSGKGDPLCMGGCSCWSCRFSLDYFGRSFAPETDHYSVAVLDSCGNLILRVGKYGNVEDGKPLIADGGPSNTRSIGGDEVSLFHAAYLATHTDKRLFIADAGNTRLLSVKLDYHENRRIPLKNAVGEAK